MVGSFALLLLCAAAPARREVVPRPPPEAAAPERTRAAKAGPVARARAEESSAARRPWVALGVGPGFPFRDGPVWARAQLRVGVPLAKLDERFELSAVAPLTVARASALGAFSSESQVIGFELVPSVRLGVRGPAALGFYGDLGVGATYLRYAFTLPGLGATSGSSAGLAVRMTAGATWTLGASWQLFVEPLSLTFHTAQEGVFRYGNTQFTSSTGAGPQASVLLGGAYTF